MSLRETSLSAVRSVVVKLGTQLLTDKTGRLDPGFLRQIAEQIVRLRSEGIVVTVVSSGAIAAGLAELQMGGRPTDLAKLQAVAAIGQRCLMDAWAAAFASSGLHVGQLLLTREDIDHRQRFLNLRNTIHAVHEMGGVPIINENDSISTDEIVRITFGDNDILAALVTHALRADLLVLLSVVNGLHDAQGNSVALVENIETARGWVRTDKSALGKGGMDSKLTAAQMVTDAGSAMVVANGRTDGVLTDLVAGREVGTLFLPSTRKRSARSRWIGSARPTGTIVVDEGAMRALVEKNKSLLPAGIARVVGEFSSGDVVAICGVDGRVIARGLSNYTSLEIENIRGKKTGEVRSILGEAAYDEVVHRDNLVLE